MVDLPLLLREHTAALHREVEDAVDLPAAVRDRADYLRLLQRLLDLHLPLEQRLDDDAWSARWVALDVDLEAHRRAPLLQDDLRGLGLAPVAGRAPVPPVTSFAGALGAWYVLEGSAVGGRVLLPALRAAAGDVPATFLAGAGRTATWPAARAALRRAGTAMGPADAQAAVRSAQAVFRAFAAHLPDPSRRPPSAAAVRRSDTPRPARSA